MRFIDIASGTSMYIVGLISGMIFLGLTFVSGDGKIITNRYKCTKTEIVGESPYREEICVQYSYKRGNQ